MNEPNNYTYEYLARKGISKETHEFFGVKTQIDAEGKPVSVAYPHPNGKVKHVRFLDQKAFAYTPVGADIKGGYAYDKFPAGSAKAITVTEGFDDAMSVYEMLGKFPVYSIKSVATALSDVRTDYDYLNSFEKIYLCLDDDDPGRKAAAQVAAVFGFGKVYLVKNAPLKDANDFLNAGRSKEFRNIWYAAKRYMPETVKSDFASMREAFAAKKDRVRYSWPWPSWNKMLGGIEVHRQVVLSGLEGTGKTEEIIETIAHLLVTYPDLNIGLMLGETMDTEIAKLLVGKVLKKPVHLDDYAIPDEEVLNAYEKLVVREDRLHRFTVHGSEDDATILSTMRFMAAACNCQVIFFDNYQHFVTGRTTDRNTEALDYLANRLESLVKELPFALISISHENDNELTRGSRNITKEADVWINIKRDASAENEIERNTQHITFKKNRQAQKTGPSMPLIYDVPTATLSEINNELPT